MTVAQIEQPLRAELSPWWRAYLYAGIMCGLRPGELLGLRWEHVNTIAGIIRVRKSVKIHEGDCHSRPVLEDLKTERSRRTLALPAAVAPMLTALRKDHAAGRLAAGPSYTDHGLVFARADGRPAVRERSGRTSSGSVSGRGPAMTGTRMSSGTASCRSCLTPRSISTRSPMRPGTSTPPSREASTGTFWRTSWRSLRA
jgi:hypothetical protein